MLNILIGGLYIESSTFTNYISSNKDFTIKKGVELLNNYTWLSEYNNINFIPGLYSRALPGGVLDKLFYTEWVEEFISILKKQNKIDGIFLDLHGAMSVQGIQDAEADLLRKIRIEVGDDLPISISMDLHGNVSDKLFEEATLLTCHKTAPHIDEEEVRIRALDNLIFAIKNKNTKIYKAKVNLPILLSGEKTSTNINPAKDIYSLTRVIEKEKDILDASIWMGFPWADEPRCHAAVVVTGLNKDKVLNYAELLGSKFWDKRKEFKFVGPTETTEKAIQLALDSDAKPFFISDTGDNPGAGGAGDSNFILKKILNYKITKKILIASLNDIEVIEKVYQNRLKLNPQIEINIGGKIDKSCNGPLTLKTTVKHTFSNKVAGRSCILNYKNTVDILVTENRFQYGKLVYFINSGIYNIEDYDIIVIKMGYLEPELMKIAKGWVMALSPGAVSQSLSQINYKKIKRPIFPLDTFKNKPNLFPFLC